MLDLDRVDTGGTVRGGSSLPSNKAITSKGRGYGRIVDRGSSTLVDRYYRRYRYYLSRPSHD